MKHKVIDNFLDKEYFDSLVTIFINKEKGVGDFLERDRWHEEKKNMSVSQRASVLPWFFQTDKEWTQQDKIFYMTHVFYEKNEPKTSFYEMIKPLLAKMKIRCLIRLKANLFPNTETLHEHTMHIDYNFPHTGAILSLNTCDGYTKLKDGTKINSVANRLLLFDAAEKHCSTTTTNVAARVNININYIQVQENGK